MFYILRYSLEKIKLLISLLNAIVFELLAYPIKLKVARYVIGLHSFPILDICTATANQCRIFRKFGTKSFGLERNVKFYKVIPKQFLHFPAICADAKRIAIRSKTFSVVLISFAIHDKPIAQRVEIIRESMRILKPGGRLIISEITLPSNFLTIFSFVIIFLNEILSGHFLLGFQFLIDTHTLKKLVENEGFVVESFEKHSFLAVQWLCLKKPEG